MAAREAGDLPESTPLVPSTVSLFSTSTSTGSQSSVNPGHQGDSNSIKKSSNTGAIVVGATGGLAALVALCVGACIFGGPWHRVMWVIQTI